MGIEYVAGNRLAERLARLSLPSKPSVNIYLGQVEVTEMF